MYPNELDQEMQGYKYGDRLTVNWIPYVASKNYWDYWGHQGTFAPPFNPNGTYESPYFDYGNRVHWGGYNGAGYGSWGYDQYRGYAQALGQTIPKDVEGDKSKFDSFMKEHPLPPPPPSFFKNKTAGAVEKPEQSTGEIVNSILDGDDDEKKEEKKPQQALTA
jgi:hypothetical protein